MKKTKFEEFLLQFFSGGVAALVVKTVTAPIERVKMLLQIQDTFTDMPKEQRYTGINDCFRRVYREQGIISFWRGNWTNILRYFPTQALGFAFKDTFKKIFLSGADKNKHFFRFFLGNILAGGVAGGSALFFTYPLEYIRTRLSADMAKNRRNRKYKGIIDCMRQTIRIDGFFGLYRGFVPALQGTIVYRAGYFGFFDTGMQLAGDAKHATLFKTFLVAQISTLVANTMSYPYDVISRRMMMMTGIPYELRKYRNAQECWMKTYREEGIPGYFRGYVANVYRGIGAGFVLVLHSEIIKYMTKNEE